MRELSGTLGLEIGDAEQQALAAAGHALQLAIDGGIHQGAAVLGSLRLGRAVWGVLNDRRRIVQGLGDSAAGLVLK